MSEKGNDMGVWETRINNGLRNKQNNGKSRVHNTEKLFNKHLYNKFEYN